MVECHGEDVAEPMTKTDGGASKSSEAAQRLPRPPYIYAQMPEMAIFEHFIYPREEKKTAPHLGTV